MVIRASLWVHFCLAGGPDAALGVSPDLVPAGVSQITDVWQKIKVGPIVAVPSLQSDSNEVSEWRFARTTPGRFKLLGVSLHLMLCGQVAGFHSGPNLHTK